MSELLEAARSVLAWHERFPKHAPGQCPRMPDGRALACRCSEICPHERLRLAVEAEARKAHNVGAKRAAEGGPLERPVLRHERM